MLNEGLLICMGSVLTHELNNGTMGLMEQFLPSIQKTFNHVMPVRPPSLFSLPYLTLNTQIGVCNNNTQPYVESGYVYPVRSVSSPTPLSHH